MRADNDKITTREIDGVQYKLCSKCGAWFPAPQIFGKVCQYCIDDVLAQKQIRQERRKEREEWTDLRHHEQQIIRNG